MKKMLKALFKYTLIFAFIFFFGYAVYTFIHI